MSGLEEKIRRLEKTISQKDMPIEDKQILLKEIEWLRQTLVEHQQKLEKTK